MKHFDFALRYSDLDCCAFRTIYADDVYTAWCHLFFDLHKVNHFDVLLSVELVGTYDYDDFCDNDNFPYVCIFGDEK